MDDFGGIDIGIDPGSIDYSTSDLSNADIASSIDGLGWEGYDPSMDQTQGWSSDNSLDMTDMGAFSQALGGMNQSGSPNVGSPSEREISQAGGAAKVPASSGKSMFGKAADALLYDKSGELDIGKLMKIGMGLGNLIGSKQQSSSNSAADAARVQAALAQQLAQQAKGAWTPQQSQWANQFFQTPVNPNRGVQRAGLDTPSSIVPSRGYAEGGGIGALGDGRYGAPAAAPRSFEGGRSDEDLFSRTRRLREEIGGLSGPSEIMQRGNVPRSKVEHVPITDLLRSLPMLFKSLGFADDSQPQGMAEGGPTMAPEGEGALSQSAPFVGYVQSDTPGQTDLFEIKVAGGEYVFDADTVAAIGDGNNEAGAAQLDQMREEIRAHKRSAPPDEIPPPMEAMNGGSI